MEHVIDELLVGELDDFRKCDIGGSWGGGKQYSHPRLCDLSGQVLADRWKQLASFDISANEETRDRQRVQLKKEWEKRKR